ncbi:unnamed protein product [Polarella glacialis]|uniref:Secreted protein n=1 Tax=Polarella glacialis TaxID=89957 RepID=A0A813EN29_POLGL|nr:unnamed protein product [Polarella glacialis]
MKIYLASLAFAILQQAWVIPAAKISQLTLVRGARSNSTSQPSLMISQEGSCQCKLVAPSAAVKPAGATANGTEHLPICVPDHWDMGAATVSPNKISLFIVIVNSKNNSKTSNKQQKRKLIEEKSYWNQPYQWGSTSPTRVWQGL